MYLILNTKGENVIMKKRIVMVLLAFAVSTTVFSGCGNSQVKQNIKQEETTKKENKEEEKSKKQTKDGLVSDAKKDAKEKKEDSTKKEKDDPKESADKKDNVEQKQVKENKTETAKSESKPKETSKPSNKPTENKKPSNNSTSKPTPETKPQNNSTPKPQHTHSWVAQTRNEYHDAITHKETVVIEEAWDEEVVAGYWECCNVCGADITNDPYTHAEAHMIAGEGGRWHTEIRWETVHHPAVTEERVVVDKEAWTETIVDGYKCSCGATK